MGDIKDVQEKETTAIEEDENATTPSIKLIVDKELSLEEKTQVPEDNDKTTASSTTSADGNDQSEGEETAKIGDAEVGTSYSRGSMSVVSENLPPIPYYPPSLPPHSLAKPPSPPPLFSRNSQRLRIGLMLMLGLYVTVSMRLNLSMAVVCMVNSTAFPSTARPDNSRNPIGEGNQPQCTRTAEDMAHQGYSGTLLWSPQMQSILLSATFYGSLATVTISGTIADKFGPKFILGGAACVYIIVTLATPFLSQYSYLAYFVSRLVMGLAEGFVAPCLGSMAGRWFPHDERSTMAAIYTSGNQLAASLSSVISAGLCSSPLGWTSIFYLFGALGIVWLVGWFIFATNVPDENAFISVRETLYLRETIQRKKKVGSVPWRSMLRSKPIYACLIAQFAFNFSTTIMMAFLPTYFRDELLLPLGQNGLYTTIPFVSQLITKNIISIVADKLKQKACYCSLKILKPTTCAILFQTISTFGGAISMMCLAILPSCERPWLAAIFLALYGAYFGTMTSIVRTAGCMANVVAPLWLSLVLLMNTPFTWKIVFATCGLLNIVSGVVFFIYGDAEVQDWAKDDYRSEKAESIASSNPDIHPVEKSLKDI